MKKVKCDDALREKAAPFMDRELGVTECKTCLEMAFEGLYCMFATISVMTMLWHKLVL